VRPLGKGTSAVVDCLSGLLAEHLPAAELVERGREALRKLLPELPELRLPPEREGHERQGH
jgi:hypothetical protein